MGDVTYHSFTLVFFPPSLSLYPKVLEDIRGKSTLSAVDSSSHPFFFVTARKMLHNSPVLSMRKY